MSEFLKLLTYWRPWMIWAIPMFLAFVGFLVGCFRGDNQLIGRSMVIMILAINLGRAAMPGDYFS